MELVRLLEESQDEVLREASQALRRSHLKHYESSGYEQYERYLEDLLVRVMECLRTRRLHPILSYAQRVANERFDAGFEISEVQSAFNALEEAIWHVVISHVPVGNLVEATGLVGTVLGAAKDTLARTWVSLATRQHVLSLDLEALFEGAAS
jgi:hypothetical protein